MLAIIGTRRKNIVLPKCLLAREMMKLWSNECFNLWGSSEYIYRLSFHFKLYFKVEKIIITFKYGHNRQAKISAVTGILLKITYCRNYCGCIQGHIHIHGLGHIERLFPLFDSMIICFEVDLQFRIFFVMISQLLNTYVVQTLLSLKKHFILPSWSILLIQSTQHVFPN